MGHGLQPGAILYGCAGALIGLTTVSLVQLADLNASATHLAPAAPSATTEKSGSAPFTIAGHPEVTVVASPAPRPQAELLPKTIAKTVAMGAGGTLLGILQKTGLAGTEAHLLVEALTPIYDPRHLKAGQSIDLEFAAGESGAPETLQKLAFEIEPGRSVTVTRREPSVFAAELVQVETVREDQAFAGTIRSSLYEAAINAGVPANVLVEMIKLFSYDVDFQRDIRSEDDFELLFDRYVAEDGRVIRTGDIRYASMTLRGRTFDIYAFTHDDGHLAYYDENGKAIRKALMRTPINGARLSSTFGLRKHPVLGYSKMHRGVDFAAPTGTPIYAAGDGVIEKRQRWGSFGNYIRIRHGGGFSTAYAHMSRFAKGHGTGMRVRQGEIIGYVGTTGRSTGPHLHYEVLKDGGQVNPMKIRFPSATALAGIELERFQKTRAEIDLALASVRSNRDIAMVRKDGGSLTR